MWGATLKEAASVYDGDEAQSAGRCQGKGAAIKPLFFLKTSQGDPSALIHFTGDTSGIIGARGEGPLQRGDELNRQILGAWRFDPADPAGRYDLLTRDSAVGRGGNDLSVRICLLRGEDVLFRDGFDDSRRNIAMPAAPFRGAGRHQ